MSPRETVQGIIREALDAAVKDGRLTRVVTDALEPGISVVLPTPGAKYEHNVSVVTVDIYEEAHL